MSLARMGALTAAMIAAMWLVPASEGQAPQQAKAKAGPIPRTKDGKPDVSGLWASQSRTAPWDVEDHPASFGVPEGKTIVIDPPNGKIPYTPRALVKRKDTIDNHAFDDPQAHCYLSGVPRVVYAPFGFQILVSKGAVVMAYENFHIWRVIPTDGRKPPSSSMKLFGGYSSGKWEGDTLVVNVTNQNGGTWLDMAGNYTTPTLHVVERYTMIDSDTINYEATLDDPAIYSRPWKMAFQIGRNRQPGFELMELACWEGERDLKHYTDDTGKK